MNKLLQNFGSMTPLTTDTKFLQKAHTSKSSLESIRKFCFWSSLVVSIFNMHAGRPIRPHMAIEPKIEVSAGGKAFTPLSL
jgi:hypothetical protein